MAKWNKNLNVIDTSYEARDKELINRVVMRSRTKEDRKLLGHATGCVALSDADCKKSSMLRQTCEQSPTLLGAQTAHMTETSVDADAKTDAC